jgi:hypothetical protein
MRRFGAGCWLAIVPAFVSLLSPTMQQGLEVVPSEPGHQTLSRLHEIKPQAGPAKPARAIEGIASPELRYRLIERFGDPWYCDPDLYPLAIAGRERTEALQGFADIARDAPAFQAMAKHLDLEKVTEFSDDQKILLYREYKRLRAISLEPEGNKFRFGISVSENSGKSGGSKGLGGKGFGNKGFRIAGLIDADGAVSNLQRVPVVLSCPICLAIGTRIDIPGGPVAVEELTPGTLVWTLDARGKRVAMPVLDVRAMRVPAGHLMIHLSFKDGRELWVSPGHPTVDGRTVDQLRPGAAYDGATIQSAALERYAGRQTFDLLPAGDTGFYWADGILLASTLR